MFSTDTYPPDIQQ